MFRFIRIAILLTVLLVVAANQWLTFNRMSSWEKPLWITIYPVLADPGDDVRRYAASLSAGSFQDIVNFLRQQAARYGHQIDTPVVIQVARPLEVLPPALPARSSGLSVAVWSLKMRWWSFINSRQQGLVADDIKMFVIYQDKEAKGRLERSVGIKNGSFGVVNAVASRQAAAHNRIVISHELLHIMGATDKYDLYSGQPIAPDGIANPDKSPLYPQQLAEIMGARIAVSADRWRRPASLKSCVVGARTASEIGWLKN